MVRVAVAEALLNDPQVDAGFQQVGRVRMAQRVHMRALVKAALPDRPAKGALQTAARDRPPVMGEAVGEPVSRRRGKEPGRRAMGPPVGAEHRQEGRGERHVPVLIALAANVQDEAGAVDLGHLQTRPFQQAQPARVDRRQTNPVDRDPDRRQDAADLVTTQDHRQRLLRGRADDAQQGPRPAKGLFEEEPDPAQGDRRRRARDLLLVRQVQEVLPQVVFGDLVRTSVVMVGELTHGVHVAALRPCGEAPQLHILEHPLSQTGHDDLLSREVAASLEGDRRRVADRVKQEVRVRVSSIRRRRI